MTTSTQRNILSVVQWATDQDKLWLITQLVGGGIDMSEKLADALIPVTEAFERNYERLCAAVEG